MLNVQPKYNYENSFARIRPINQNEQIDNDEIKRILNYVVYCGRKMLSQKVDITNSPLTNMCDLMQSYLGYLLESLGVYCIPNVTLQTIGKNINYHSYTTVVFNTSKGVKIYLLDITYRQFFLLENCTKENFAIKNNKIIIAPDPGYFICKDILNIDTAAELLYNGFIELTPKTAKIYGDSFKLGQTNKNIFDVVGESGYSYLLSFLNKRSSYSYDKDELFKDNKNCKIYEKLL